MSFVYIQPAFSLRNIDRERFPPEEEIASIFCLAEERRKKKGLLGKNEENLTHLLKTNYPIYAIRWRNSSVLIDGLSSISTRISYTDLIDTKGFIENLMKAREKVGSLRAFLSSSANTFKGFIGDRQMNLNNVIPYPSLISEIVDFVRKAESTIEYGRDMPVFFKVDKHMVDQIISEFDTLVKKVENDIEALQKIESILLSSVDLAKKKIIEDRQNEFNNFNKEIENVKPIINEKIAELKKTFDKEFEDCVKEAEKETEPLIIEKEKNEKELRKLSLIEVECVDERKILNQKLDKIGEDYWSKEAEENKARKTEIWKILKIYDEKLDKINFNLGARKKRLKDKFESNVRIEEDKIFELEIHRDSAFKVKDLLIEEIEHRYSKISSQLLELLEIKRNNLKRLLEMTTEWTPENNSIILIPLYLIKYQNQNIIRYDVCAPSIINNYSAIKNKTRRAFWSLETKILKLMSPLGEEFGNYFTKNFLNVISTNKKFEEVISQILDETNIFTNSSRGKVFGDGIEYLKNEGWLSNDEYKRVLSALNLSFKVSTKL